MGSGRFRRRALRVLVADDDERVRNVLTRALEAQPGFEVVATATTAEEAVSAALASLPDIALLDVNMPGGGGPVAARGIAQASPGTVIVALSALEHAAAVRAMLDAGARSYAVKGIPLPQLVAILESVVEPPQAAASPESPEPVRSGQPVRVLVAEGDPALLSTLAGVVEAAPELALVGLAQNPHHAVTLAARTLPDVALVDVRMPGGGGALVAAEIRSCSPDTRVIAFSSHSDPESVLGMVGSGVTSYLLDASPVPDLVEAIVGAHRGGSRLADEVAAVVLRELSSRMHESGAASELLRLRRTRIEGLLEADSLRMVFQPIQHLGGTGAIGYEALARFSESPIRTPDVCFAEAASVGLGVELEIMAVRCALLALPELPRGAFLALNVSPEAAVTADLRGLVGGHEDRIVLEITEHAPVHDYEELASGIANLRDRGVRVAVDDCGAGFASLRHVLLLSPEFIKLDIALCRDVRQPTRMALARALVNFAAEVGSIVVAEGIETADDQDALMSLGVRLGQGFHLGDPGDLPALTAV